MNTEASAQESTLGLPYQNPSNSNLPSIQELRQETDESNPPIRKALPNQNLPHNQSHFQRKRNPQNTHFAPESIKEIECEEDQARFKFARKKRESKTSNLLVIESLTYKENTSKDNLTLLIKREEDGKMKEMNEMLEFQKKLEMDRYLYELFMKILEKVEESEWKGDPHDFTEKEDFEEEMAMKPQFLENSCFLEVMEMNDIDRLFVDLELLDRKSMNYKLKSLYLTIRRKSSKFCFMIINHPLFEITTLLVIILNCIEILIDNSSLTGGVTNTPNVLIQIDNVFFAFYITELTIKVVALGFIMNEGAYLKDGWNFLDFFIISTAIINKIIVEYGINLKSLRALRVLRPLKVIATLKQLQTILESLFQALPLLADSFLILIFCYLLYALAGLQLFSGLLKKRCVDKITGLIFQVSSGGQLCGNLVCDSSQFCGKLLQNPNLGIMNFDTIFYSFLNVFQIVTVDNWSSTMYSVQTVFTNYISVYFLSLVIIGGLFLVNLTLAIIKVKFSGLSNQTTIKPKNPKKSYDFHLMKQKNIWHRKSGLLALNSLTVEKTSLKNLEKSSRKSIKSAKTSKKSNNNPFSLKILSQLRTEFGKIANNVSSYANEIGKATKMIGKTVGVDKLFRVMDKFSPLRFWKKIEALEVDSNRKTNIEDLNPRYLRLEVQILKEYASDSIGDIVIKMGENKKKTFLQIHNLGTIRTRRLNRSRRNWKYEYRVPKYVKKETSSYEESIVLPLRKEKINKLETIPKKVDIEKEPISLEKKPEIENNLLRFKTKKVQSIRKAITANNNNISMSYEEASNLMNEKIDNLAVEKELLQKELFNNIDLYEKLKLGKISRNMWSGNPVLRFSLNNRHRHISTMIKSFTITHYEVFHKGFDLLLIKIVKFLNRLVLSSPFNNFIFLIVIMNGVLLCLEGVISDSYLTIFNDFFTCVFTVEMVFKLIGLGIRPYFHDAFNKMDFIIVITSIMDILMTEIIISPGDSLRVFRSIRVFRLFRILRTLDFAKKIADFIIKNSSSFIYIAFLLLLFNFVYGLLGMDLFTNITVTDSGLLAYNFNDYASSFMTAFDLLTLDNWSNILIIGQNSDAGIFQTVIYSISWIFIGNYILMNLFLAVLLDGLTNELIATEFNKDKKRLSAFSLEKQKEIDLKKQLIYEEKEKPSKENTIERKYSDLSDSVMTQISQRGSTIKEPKPNDLLFLMNHKCEYSLFLFSKNNFLRRWCHKIVFHSSFETLIFLLIVFCSVKMIVDTYLTQENTILQMIDDLTTVIFLIESLMKIISKGLFLEKETYIREPLNQLDFFIVITSVISTLLEQFGISFVSVIRILRVMRPLRFISKNSNIKIVVVALIESLKGILNVFLIIFVIFIMFASFGVSIFKDRFGYCNDVLNFNVSINDCPPGEWTTYVYNFDNIVQAMFTLLVIATYDGWMPISVVAVNSNTADYGPTLNNTRDLANLYFVLFIIVIPIFFLNLFIGVIFYHFVISEKKSKNILLTDSQMRWIQLQKLIINLEPKYAQMKLPTNKLRRLCLSIVNHRYFEEAILLVIVGSIVNMALTYDDCPTDYANTISMVDQIFMLIFVIEIMLKLFGFGFLGYFMHRWNQFDFFIVIFGLIDLIVNTFFSQQLEVFQVGPKILRAVRMLRIGRLLRLVKKFDGMLKLLQTLMLALPMTFNVLAVLLLIFFIYTIIGCSLYGDILFDPFINFKDFLYGMMTLFKMSTTDNWSSCMLTYLTYNSYCPIYFVSFIIISQFILTNLFILVLLQQFDETENNTKAGKTPIQEFHEHVDKFRSAWIECTAKFKGQKMKKTQLIRFFRSLEPPLGFKDEENIDIIAKFIMEMKIQGDKEGFVYFNELLFKTMKNVYGVGILDSSNENIINELKKHEKHTTQQLAKKQNKKTRAARRSAAVSMKGVTPVIMNPLQDFLHIRLCFCSWKKFAINLREKADKCMNNEQEMPILDSNESEDTGDLRLSMIREEIIDEGHNPSQIEENSQNLEEEISENKILSQAVMTEINGESNERKKEQIMEKYEMNKGVVGLPNFVEDQ